MQTVSWCFIYSKPSSIARNTFPESGAFRIRVERS